MREYLVHGPNRASWHQRICCRQRFPQSLAKDERVSRRPHHDASRKPALEEAGCSQFRLRRRNKRRRFGRLIDVTLHVAHHADYLAQFTADVKVLSERTHTLQKTSRK